MDAQKNHYSCEVAKFLSLQKLFLHCKIASEQTGILKLNNILKHKTKKWKKLLEKFIQMLGYWNIHTRQNVTVIRLWEILQWISL